MQTGTIKTPSADGASNQRACPPFKRSQHPFLAAWQTRLLFVAWGLFLLPAGGLWARDFKFPYSEGTHAYTCYVAPNSHYFEIDGIDSYRTTKWYYDGVLKETDESGFWKVDPDITLNVTAGNHTLEAKIYSGATLKATYTITLKCRSISNPVWIPTGRQPEGWPTKTQFTMRVTVSGFDVGETVYFDIYEDDDTSGDDHVPPTRLATYNGGSTISCPWPAEWVDDGLAGDPEYYFVARTASGYDNSKVSAQSGTTIELYRVGAVRVTLEPSGARNAGAQWRLTRGPDTGWRSSGDTVPNVPIGSYTIQCKAADNWNTPGDISIEVLRNATATTTRTYTAMSISPNSWDAPASGGSRTVSVTANSGSRWTVSNPCSSWVTVSPTSGTGSGPVTVSVSANNTGSQRNCTLTIAGESFSISQSPVACSATRSLPSCYIPGTPVTVSISCAPGTGTLAYGVEDSPPAGWAVGQINEGGTWDDVQKKVKWVFLDGNPRVLSYAATPPSGEDGSKCFAGAINCGGVNVPIAGTNCICLLYTSPSPRDS